MLGNVVSGSIQRLAQGVVGSRTGKPGDVFEGEPWRSADIDQPEQRHQAGGSRVVEIAPSTPGGEGLARRRGPPQLGVREFLRPHTFEQSRAQRVVGEVLAVDLEGASVDVERQGDVEAMTGGYGKPADAAEELDGPGLTAVPGRRHQSV
jgi:hypothetical protein